jgi:sugar phosphate isomerase/epimerase
MHLGIFAKTFPRPTLEETLDAVAGQGLTHIQFNMSSMGLPTLPDRLDEGSCVWIAQSLNERGLTMAAVSGTFNMCAPVDSRLENNLRRLDVLAAACRWLDTRIITLCTGTLDLHDMWRWNVDNIRRSAWERLVSTMKEAVKIADRHEVMLAFEPEINNIVSSVMRARRLLDEVGSPWLKVVIDPANLVHAGDLSRFHEMLYEAFDWLGRDIILAHAKNPRWIDKIPTVSTDDSGTVVSWATPQVQLEIVEEFTKKLYDKINSEDGGQEVLRWLDWQAFFEPYVTELIKLGYQGAVIMHGLKEADVPVAATFHRALLKAVSKKHAIA